VDTAILRDVGVAAIESAMRAGKIVVIDEIGKMELLSSPFRDVVMRAILGPNLVLGTIIYKSHPEADVFKTLAQVTLWEVNDLSRDGLPKKTLAWLKEFERPAS
jgi:nucleoside-triphosphatase